jgi:hypothetical protein
MNDEDVDNALNRSNEKSMARCEEAIRKEEDVTV